MSTPTYVLVGLIAYLVSFGIYAWVTTTPCRECQKFERDGFCDRSIEFMDSKGKTHEHGWYPSDGGLFI